MTRELVYFSGYVYISEEIPLYLAPIDKFLGTVDTILAMHIFKLLSTNPRRKV